jgi:Rap guanine nucleotide exchange factor 2
VPEKYTKLLADLNMIMDPSRNFSRYRNLIKCESTRPPLIPIYPMVSKDLAFVDIGNKTRVEGLINMEKLRLVAKEIRALTAMCSAPLRNVPDNVIAMNENDQTSKYATMKRRGGARSAPDAKGMYQEALMIRKVKAYLAHVAATIVTDEEVLQRMSVEVEPPLAKASTHSISASSLRRPASPTPSRASSLSVASDGKRSNASGETCY